jgi:hypothetical protein
MWTRSIWHALGARRRDVQLKFKFTTTLPDHCRSCQEINGDNTILINHKKRRNLGT